MKLITLIPVKEAKSDSDVVNLVKKIQHHTNDNDHTLGIIALANFLKNSKRVKILNAIDDIHTIEGSMPTHLSKYRDEVKENLLDEYRRKYGKQETDYVESAF